MATPLTLPLARAGLPPRPTTPLRVMLRRIATLFFVHGILIAGAVVILMPFVWMLITSIKSPAEIFAASFTLWPKHFNAIENYTFALNQVPLLRFAVNGFIICATLLVVQVLVAVPCAYALAKLRFPGRSTLFALVLLGLCIPIQVPALPLYMGLANFGLLNTYFAIMMPFFLSVFAIFLFRQFFKGYPDEIIYAARLDGMSEFEIVWLIVVPSAWPAIAAFSVFSFIAHWNDLYWPLIVISDTKLATPPLGMMFFADAETGTNYGALTAAATVLTAPLVIAFLIARRHFIDAITMTGIK
jgi:multiple sugar transport system permease protein